MSKEDSSRTSSSTSSSATGSISGSTQVTKKRRADQDVEVTSGAANSTDLGPSVSSSQVAATAVSSSSSLSDSQNVIPLTDAAVDASASTSRAPKKLQKRNEKGESALHLAAKKNELQQAKKLIKAGLDVNVQDNAGWTPLHESVIRDFVSLSKLLLAKGADPNLTGMNGQTALHDAASNGLERMCRLLRTYGADPLRANDSGETPVVVAQNPKIVEILNANQTEFIDDAMSSCSSSAPSEADTTPSEALQPGSSTSTVPARAAVTETQPSSSTNPPPLPSSDGSGGSPTTQVAAESTSRTPRQQHSPTPVTAAAAEPVSSSTSSAGAAAAQSVSDVDSLHVQESESDYFHVSSSSPTPVKTKFFHNRGSSSAGSSTNTMSSATNANQQGTTSATGTSKMEISQSHSGVAANLSSASESNKDPYAFEEDEEASNDVKTSLAAGSSSPPSSGSGLPLKLRISEQWKTTDHQQQQHGVGTSSSSFNNQLVASSVPATSVDSYQIPDSMPNPESSQPGSSCASSDEDLMRVPPLRIKIPQESSYEMVSTASSSAAATSSAAAPTTGSMTVSSKAAVRSTRSSQRRPDDAVSSSTLDDSAASPPISQPASSGVTTIARSSTTETEVPTAAPPPKKRKLRPRAEEVAAAAAQLAAQPFMDPTSYKNIKIPENPIDRLANVRRQLRNRLSKLSVVQPKAPKGFAEFKLMTKRYLLAHNKYAVELPTPLPPPTDLEFDALRDLFQRQEEVRQGLRLSQQAERERLVLAAEQEMIRAHTRAALAMASQPRQLSFCAAVADKDFTHLPADFEDSSITGGLRDRYSSRQFLAWVDDIEKKFTQSQRSLTHRQLNEADALMAVQKMDWEMRYKELRPDERWSPNLWLRIARHHVPLVEVPLQFELFKTRPV